MRAVVMDIETEVLRSSDILAAEVVAVGLRPQVVNVLCISIAVTSLLSTLRVIKIVKNTDLPRTYSI